MFRKKIKLFSLIIFFSAVIYFSYLTYTKIERIIREKELFRKRELAWTELRKDLGNKLKEFKGKVGILIKDLETNWVISFNEELSFPAASLIKVPIMLACFSAVEEGRMKFEDTVKLKNSDKTSGSGILKNLPAGKIFNIERLVELMITVSDNTATNILIEKLGFEYLNNYFNKIGLRNTTLVRRMMDFRERKKGVDNFTTAKDMACVFEKIYRKQKVKANFADKSLGFLEAQKYRDRIPSKLPPEIKVAHKTGLERGVCHDTGIVFGPKGDFLIVVLTEGAEAKNAKEFIADVSFRVYSYYLKF
ncbi:MAG: class A beta-lactamase-related serine hydrolase [Candidatus Omnitrophica bacterium]|nr:class A beta-lactamase-related serine hydrolase [Candidatus Omnitrophota bacterium]